jgi:hypothetical protein
MQIDPRLHANHCNQFSNRKEPSPPTAPHRLDLDAVSLPAASLEPVQLPTPPPIHQYRPLLPTAFSIMGLISNVAPGISSSSAARRYTPPLARSAALLPPRVKPSAKLPRPSGMAHPSTLVQKARMRTYTARVRVRVRIRVRVRQATRAHTHRGMSGGVGQWHSAHTG